MDSPIGRRGLSELPGSWKTMPTVFRKGFSSWLFAPVMSMPQTVILPADTGRSATAARPMVVLPEPDSPTRPITSPGLRRRLMPRRRGTPADVLLHT